MAVEIRELVIKAVIVDENVASSEADDEGGGSSGAYDRDKIIQECVNQVLKVLKKSKNR